MKHQPQTKLLIEIPSDLKRDLKIAAAQRGVTMKSLAKTGLQWVLDSASDLNEDRRGGLKT